MIDSLIKIGKEKQLKKFWKDKTKRRKQSKKQ